MYLKWENSESQVSNEFSMVFSLYYLFKVWNANRVWNKIIELSVSYFIPLNRMKILQS